MAPWRGQATRAVSVVPDALAERAVVVRAAILDREQLAAAVEDADREQPGLDELHRAGRQLLERRDDDLSQSSRPCHSSGSGVPFERLSATLSDAEPEDRALQPRRASSGMPTSSSSSSLAAPRPRVAVFALDELGQHRGRSLRDRAAAAFEADLLDRLAVGGKPDRDRDLVAAERVLALGVRVGIGEQPVVARVLVVVEDHLAVEVVELAHAPRPARPLAALIERLLRARRRRRAGRSPRGRCRGRSSRGSSRRHPSLRISGWQQWWPARIAIASSKSSTCATSCG